ncbi:MAG: hypothetical protein EBS38_08350 [Actinobacteria bacterium]|nr:hypothetical protein [Actinomycetota bacterium]
MAKQDQPPWREAAMSVGVFGLFVGGLTLAIVGGLVASTAMLGVGLAIVVGLTVLGIYVRERNIAS